MHKKYHFFTETFGWFKKKQYLCTRFRESNYLGAVVQLVRIPACHAVGREFESRPHRKSASNECCLQTLLFVSG